MLLLEDEKTMKVEQRQQQHYLCNICFKSFPSPSSLSSHITACSSSSSTTFTTTASPFHPQQQQHHCKECGKRFQSMKALCGHMACHSDKLKLFNHNTTTTTITNNADSLDHSWEDNTNNNNTTTVDDHHSVMDSQSDNETGFPTRQRRSRRLRHKNHHDHAAYHVAAHKYSTTAGTVSVVANSNNNNNNCSSSVSGIIDVQDQDQDGAMCLMMLSRDHSGNWAGFSSFPADSSHNNSIVLEAAAIRPRRKPQNNEVENVKKDKHKLLKSCDSFNSSSSGYFQNGIDNDDESDGWVATGFRYDDDDLVDYKKKRSKFECFICYKVFHSPQALGGHIASHKKGNPHIIASGSSGENSLDQNDQISPPYEISSSKYTTKISTTKKVKEKKTGWKNGKKYECPICYKVLKSGQALGGHKRIHNVNLFNGNNSEDRNKMIRNNMKLTSPSSSPTENIDHLIDLNFPPPI